LEFASPDVVVVGHVTRDLTPDGPRIGGAAAYASLTAARLGFRASLVTSASPEYDFSAALPGVRVTLIPANETTAFEHRYKAGKRIQYLRSRASDIGPCDIPAHVRRGQLLFLAPVANEVDPRIVSEFPNARSVAAGQGWLRRIGRAGLVVDGAIEGLDLEALAGRLSALILSEVDLADKPLPERWLSAFPAIVITRGHEGLSVYDNGQWWNLAAFPATERDSTGAGDVMAAAFGLSLAETGDLAGAIRFGAAAASLSVEGRGLDGIPTREQIEQRLREHPEIQLRAAS
jgi:sugar/nucleoside kinase (ribokinase family)